MILKMTYPNGFERTLTVISAKYANEDGSAIMLTTQESSDVAIENRGRKKQLWDQLFQAEFEIQPFQ
jgi:hypothetical protein